jgi:hypothetical protein
VRGGRKAMRISRQRWSDGMGMGAGAGILNL